MKKLILLVSITLFIGKSHAQKFISSHTVGNQTKSYSKVLVVVKAKDANKRAELEDDMVNRLEKMDIEAVPSYLRLTNEVLKKGKDEKELELFANKLKEKGFDGILVTSFVEASKSVEINPSQYSTATVPRRYGRFGRYYGTARVGVYEPASIEKNKNFVLESLLYDLRSTSKEDSLHWIGKIEISNPSSFEKASEKYAKKVVKKIAKEAIQ